MANTRQFTRARSSDYRPSRERAKGVRVKSVPFRRASHELLRGDHGLPHLELESGRIIDRSLQTIVYGKILRALYDGTLKPGERLIEEDLAKRLGMSRLPIREALTRLANEGLVERVPRRGSFIAHLSAKDVEDIRSVRLLIETHAARQAAARISGADIAALEEIVANMADAHERTDWIESVSWNMAFHDAVMRIADNAMLHRTWMSVNPFFWHIAVAEPNPRHRDTKAHVLSHKALIQALQSGDANRAERAFREHVSRSAGRAGAQKQSTLA